MLLVRSHNKTQEVSIWTIKVRWNCTYHIVFIPKYRRRIMYGTNRKDLVEIIPKVCEMKGVTVIDKFH